MDKVFDPGTCLLLADAANTLQEAESGQFTNSTRTGYANLITAPRRLVQTSETRQLDGFSIPISGHPKGVVNVTFADNHAASVKPTKFQTDTIEGISLKFPTEFGEQVRVSPYRPYVRQ
ncbi:MAG: hypothetical protein R3E58_05295 [Phycisphaerae bacterium]